MPTLWGRQFTREELMQRIGRLEQVAGVRLVERGDGMERGVRVLEFRTGSGFSFDVLVDRAMDIGRCEHDGRALGWQSATGFIGPWYYEPEELGWLRGFGGGLLTTCGMEHALFMAEDTAEHYNYPPKQTERFGLHGRVSYLPAKLAGYGARWDGDECTLWAEGGDRASGGLRGEPGPAPPRRGEGRRGPADDPRRGDERRLGADAAHVPLPHQRRLPGAGRRRRAADSGQQPDSPRRSRRRGLPAIPRSDRGLHRAGDRARCPRRAGRVGAGGHRQPRGGVRRLRGLQPQPVAAAFHLAHAGSGDVCRRHRAEHEPHLGPPARPGGGRADRAATGRGASIRSGARRAERQRRHRRLRGAGGGGEGGEVREVGVRRTTSSTTR